MFIFVKNMSQTMKLNTGGVIAIVVTYLIIMVIYTKKKKRKAKNWESQNPTTAKVYVKAMSIIVKRGGLNILSVDGEKPNTFIEGMINGFYILPGTHVIEAIFTPPRPRGLHNTGTTSYGPAKVEIEAQTGKSYAFYFDEGTKSFLFEEMN